MPKYTREDKSVYYAADKERPTSEYQQPPPRDLELRDLPVGLLNHNFVTYSGPQRNRPEDNISKKTGDSTYRRSLYLRSRAYGSFQWALLTPRVVSERANGVLYTLDGNGSNHWLERLFGPEFPVPCAVLKGLTLKQEKDIFLKIQERKRVSPTEQYKVDTEYDEASLAAGIKKVVGALGLEVSQSTTDPCAIGRTTCEWVVRKYRATGVQTGLSALHETLRVMTELFPEDDPKRTNGALVKALAIILHNDDEFTTVTREDVLSFMRGQGPAALVGQSRGRGGEQEVLQRLHEALGD